jgi:hypothetical protein
MGFFKRNIGTNKRKVSAIGNATKKRKFLQQKGKTREKNPDDEEISSDDEFDKNIDLNENNEENFNDNEQTEDNDEQYEDSQALAYREAKKLVKSVEVYF